MIYVIAARFLLDMGAVITLGYNDKLAWATVFLGLGIADAATWYMLSHAAT